MKIGRPSKNDTISSYARIYTKEQNNLYYRRKQGLPLDLEKREDILHYEWRNLKEIRYKGGTKSWISSAAQEKLIAWDRARILKSSSRKISKGQYSAE